MMPEPLAFDAVRHLTEALTALVSHHIWFVGAVPTLTNSGPAQNRRRRVAALHILFVRDRFEVVWIATPPVSTGVVEFHSIGHRPVFGLERQSVSLNQPATSGSKANLSIPVRVNAASPKPTSVG